MKRVLALLCVAVLLLSGCADPSVHEPQKPQTVYGETPTQTEFTVSVAGKTLSGLYEQNGVLYLEEGMFMTLLGGTTKAQLGDAVHTITITLDGYTRTFTTADQEEPAIFDGQRWFLPCKGILETLGYHLFEDVENKHHYYTYYPEGEDLTFEKEVPILMYHAVGDNLWGIESLFVSPSSLRQQFQYLKDNGYTPIFFEDLAKADQIEKPVILTFDDGYQDIYSGLMPMVVEFNFKVTVFSITGSIGTEHYLSEKNMLKMQETGLVSFQSHTVTHPELNTCTEEELEKELYESKLYLTRLTGKEPFVLCYPVGKYNDLSLKKTAEHYEFGLHMSGNTYVAGKTDPYRIYRKYVSRSTTIGEFADMID